MPQINKSDYLKNYSNAELIFSIQINDKTFKEAISVDFANDTDLTKLFNKVVTLHHSIERQILQENGYFEDFKKYMEGRYKEAKQFYD